MSIAGIALSGMNASMARLTASASNIANANSAGVAPGEPGPAPYQPVRAVQSELAGGGVASRLERKGVDAFAAFDPGSPLANADGMTGMPAVDLADELVETLVAKLAFEANARMLGTVHALERRVIDQLA